MAVLEAADPCEPDDDLLRTALELAVLRTIQTRSPGIGDQLALRVDDLEDEYRDAVEDEYRDDLDEPTPWDPLLDGWRDTAWDVLARWLGTVRRRPDAADLADRVLRWVDNRLERSGQGLEQQAILLGGPGARAPLDLGECLRDEIIAVRIWLVAGLVAVTGISGPAALARLGRRSESGHQEPTRRRGAVSSPDPATAE